MRREYARLSVQASVKDGGFWALMTGFVEPYIVPFAMALGASMPAIGFLRSVPALLGSLSQIVNERFVARLGSCRRAILADVLVQAVAVGAGAFSAFLPPPYGLYFFIIAVTLYTLSGAMSGPPWAALMGEYIPASKRGEFFGVRSQLVGFTFFAGSFAASGILSLCDAGSLRGFVIIFSLAAVFRLISFYYVGKMYEPVTRFHMPKSVTPDLLKILDYRNNRVSAMFMSAFMLLAATYLTAPYFSVYVLAELKYDYFRYTLITTIGPLMTYLVMKRWGRMADIFGSVKILKAAFFLIPAVPILWTFNSGFVYLSLVEVYSGIIWGAYLIGINNFIYEAAEPRLRTGVNAYFCFVSGLAQFGGAMTGGWLYDALPSFGGSSFIPLLLLSGILRFVSLAPLLRLVKENPGVRPASACDLALCFLGFKSVNR